MFNPDRIRGFLKTSASLLGLLLLTVATLPGAIAADAARREFNLPASSVETSLKLLSEQSGVEVLYPTNFTRGVRTNPVSGKMTPREALERMLAGTGLTAAQDEKSGALTVRRATDTSPEKKAAARVESTPASRATADSAVEKQEAVMLSPFEVSATGDRGYYGANTMSGTRLNSKLEDLASSMTVVTKEQMSDFAMLDINDIFSYEAGTEGTGNYTALSFDNNGNPVNNVELDRNNANRVRGVGPANNSFGNFATSGRVPIDPINIDRVEISRGPNSNIFGLGNAAGTVNSVPATAHLTRDRSEVQFRVDSYDGYRTSLDLNRVLKKGVLAVRGSAVFQEEGFVRKPSGVDTVRLNGMVKYQPLKNTTITASYSVYRMYGNRPNTTTPMDAISYWRQSGSPTWDPLSQTVFVNGSAAGVFPGGTTGGTNPPYFTNALIINNGGGSSILNVNPDGALTLWTPALATSTTSPLSQNQVAYRYLTTNPPNLASTQPLFQTAFPVTSKADYDWSKINLATMNYQAENTKTSNIQLEQVLYNSGRQLLAAQAAWFQEDSNALRRLAFSTPSSTGTSASRANSGYLFVDPNIRLLDGRPNPNFLRPNIGFSSPSSSLNPLRNNTYRAQLAYQIDLTRERSAWRWLGLHQISAYTEYWQSISRRFQFQDAIIDDHPWLASGVPRGNSTTVGSAPYNQASPRGTRVYYQYYVGDNHGQNVDYAPAAGFKYGVYPYSWGNATTGQFVNEPALLGSVADVGGTGAARNSWTILKTRGAVLQSHFLRERIVTTFGLRQDRNFVKVGVTPSLLPDGKTHDYARDNQWVPDWLLREGRTKTAGVVVKPLRWLSLHWNQSDSFTPSSPAQTLHLQPLPNPSGLGNDYGFALKLIDEKLSVRVNRYETKQLNSRNGTSAGLANRIVRIDVYGNSASQPFGLDYRSRVWIANAAARQGVTLTSDQLDAKVAETMHLSVEQIRGLQGAFFGTGLPLSATDDIVSKGTEIELNFNPNAFWTVKFNTTQNETLQSAVAPDLVQWIAERTPVWTSIIDTDANVPWFTNRDYVAGGAPSASNYIASNVTSQLAVVRQTVGKARPQIRKYRFNLSTSYRLAGLTEQRWLKRVNVGGALRWEDRGAIGYYGVQQFPAIVTDLDPTRPIWDKAHLYADAFVSYRTKLFRDRVGATIQLNVRNLQEGGKLQPVNALPDGTPNALRIIDPRQFILTVTFDL